MVTIYKKNLIKILYIFFAFPSLIIFFFSTAKVEGKAFEISNIEISQPFEINFNKVKVIDEGFEKAFKELIALTINSSDQKKITQIKLNEIKGMIESFSIKEEKFVDEIYYLNLGVSFNKKKIFKYFESKNIFPALPKRKKFLFIPIIIDEKKKDLLIFSNNKIFDEWKSDTKNSYLIDYILPTEDLEDLNIIKNNYEIIEQYDFKEITNKYYLNDSIVALVFKSNKELRVLSRITIKDNVILKNQSFSNIDLNNSNEIKDLVSQLKIIYEDNWKNSNQINTSIKLLLNIRVKNNNNIKISDFEKVLNQTDLIYDFEITRFDKNYILYKITFNGTPNIFLKSMKENNYEFDTQNKVWVLK